ncbi:hypothetical protein GUITHDRAFT_103968 [Guillardia theta CCMP2712]|uniref:NTF2 domain-containing protein n=1 Tax=Guillardia theta (strain CCMP2712) TaxID=905079 RepID=L1JPN4_GUITC|nr:hypothetical protein GUITHDRAFT_103968 [Guillardia theta CCMP2712]EKX50155.1 hypothetical protein GUITHDRAFT_103968 [Guillardia theta CCMP2712]|eukprot:XP_005837135.1 hypothetical protein GUITHDRAFT_103968 [Guillardia theta CCMP2712]
MDDQEIANQFASFFFKTFEKEPQELYKLYAPYSARSELICRAGHSHDKRRHAQTMRGVKADGIREIFGLTERTVRSGVKFCINAVYSQSHSQNKLTVVVIGDCSCPHDGEEGGEQDRPLHATFIEVFELERANRDMAYYICSDVLQMHENEARQPSSDDMEGLNLTVEIHNIKSLVSSSLQEIVDQTADVIREMRETQDLLQETEQSLIESSSYALRDLEMKHKMAFDHIEKQLVSLTKQLEYKDFARKELLAAKECLEKNLSKAKAEGMELEACKMKIDELNMKGKIAESERDSLARQLEGADLDLSQSKAAYSRLEISSGEKLQKTKDLLKKMLDSYKQKQAEVESLQQDFNRMRSQTFQLEKNVELLTKQRDNAIAELLDFRENVGTKQPAKDLSQSFELERHALNSTISSLRTRVERLEEENNALHTTSDKLKDDLENLKLKEEESAIASSMKIEGLQQELDQLRKDLQNRREELESAQREAVLWKEKVESHEVSLKRLREKIARLEELDTLHRKEKNCLSLQSNSYAEKCGNLERALANALREREGVEEMLRLAEESIVDETRRREELERRFLEQISDVVFNLPSLSSSLTAVQMKEEFEAKLELAVVK